MRSRNRPCDFIARGGHRLSTRSHSLSEQRTDRQGAYMNSNGRKLKIFFLFATTANLHRRSTSGHWDKTNVTYLYRFAAWSVRSRWGIEVTVRSTNHRCQQQYESQKNHKREKCAIRLPDCTDPLFIFGLAGVFKGDAPKDELAQGTMYVEQPVPSDKHRSDLSHLLWLKRMNFRLRSNEMA